MDTKTNVRRVSFSDEDQIKILDNHIENKIVGKDFSYKSITIDNNNSRFTSVDATDQAPESTQLYKYNVACKRDELPVASPSSLDSNNSIDLLTNFLTLSVSHSHDRIKEIAEILKKASLMMLENKSFNIEERAEDITSKEFLFCYIEPTAASSRKHSIYCERLKESTIKDIKKTAKRIIIQKKPNIDNIKRFLQKINTHIETLEIDQGKNKFMKYIVALMFEDIMKKNYSKSTLFNIIAMHMDNINKYFTVTDKLEVIQNILEELIHCIIAYYTNSCHSSDYILSIRDRLSQIIDFLCLNLEPFLHKAAFISSFVIANNKKIQKISPSLTKIDTISFNGINCNYGKIWGGVTLLQKHSTSGNIYHVVDDTLPDFNKFIKKDTGSTGSENAELEETENDDDFYLVETEDYNLCKKRTYNAIEHTDALFKREVYAENKKYFSGVSFGLEGSVNSHIVNINEHRDFIRITEKLIISSAMAMINLDDVVNPAIDAHGIEEKPSPETYIVSVCLINDDEKELALMQRYNDSLLHFDNQEIISETAVFSLNSKKPKLMPYGVGMDLFVKIVSFNFIQDHTNREIANCPIVKSNNNLALASILGEYKDDSFSSIKILKALTTNSNLDLSQLNDNNSLLATYCSNLIKKYSSTDIDQLNNPSIISFKLDDEELQYLSKIEYLIDSLLIMNLQANYDIYNFSAAILLISSLIGGAQLFCCENGLTKINILDNHIKFLTTDVFINNNKNIDFNTSFQESMIYKQIAEITQNQHEKYLLY